MPSWNTHLLEASGSCAEQNKNEYLRLSGRFIAKAAEGSGVRVQGTVLVVLEPLNLGDHYQLFLINTYDWIETFLQGSRNGIDRAPYWVA